MEAPKLLDKLTICGQSSLNSDDVSVLALLYTPLIGQNAFSLYMAFYSLLDRNSFTRLDLFHRDIYDILATNGKEFYKARKKLEGIGLLNSYQKDDEYIYMLIPPVSAKQFLVDGVLGGYLAREVSSYLVDELIKKFTHQLNGIALNEYANVTIPFDAVYKTKEVEPLNLKANSLMNKTRKKRLDMQPQEFFYNIFYDGIKPETFGSTPPNRIKDLVISNAIGYRLSELEMIKIYNDSLINNLFDEKKFIRNIKRDYSFKTGNTSLKLAAEEKTADTQMQELLDQTPFELIKSAKGDLPTANEIEVVTKLYTSYPKVDKLLINFCIMYVLKTKLKGEQLNYNYIDAVLVDWLGRGITTVSDAQKHIEKKAATKPKGRRKEPIWVEEGMKNIEKGVQDL